MITYKQLFYALKRDGDVWVKGKNEIYWLFKNIDWNTFGWAWERAMEKEWWHNFKELHNMGIGEKLGYGWIIKEDYINPARFIQALREFLSKEELPIKLIEERLKPETERGR